jgi:hypothetical protein
VRDATPEPGMSEPKMLSSGAMLVGKTRIIDNIVLG